MAQTTSRHCECRFMPTVAFAEFTFPIGCTRKTSCLPSSNCSCPSKTKTKHKCYELLNKRSDIYV